MNLHDTTGMMESHQLKILFLAMGDPDILERLNVHCVEKVTKNINLIQCLEHVLYVMKHYLESWTRRLDMNCIAIGDTSWKRSSGNSNWQRVMLQKVSCFVSPPKGVHPVNST